jgi:uncharacterized Zn finger protein
MTGPADGPRRVRVDCPFCGADDVELVSAWGGQMITSQVRCRACGTYFEAIRAEFDGPQTSSATPEEPTRATAKR